jgi:hypothetical protein
MQVRLAAPIRLFHWAMIRSNSGIFATTRFESYHSRRDGRDVCKHHVFGSWNEEKCIIGSFQARSCAASTSLPSCLRVIELGEPHHRMMPRTGLRRFHAGNSSADRLGRKRYFALFTSYFDRWLSSSTRNQSGTDKREIKIIDTSRMNKYRTQQTKV